ncbi:MAG TPA: hypothetical protein VF310_08670 [Vicinamibacteria bacterium]
MMTRITLRSSIMAAAALAALAGSAAAQSPAASSCPTYFFLSGELAANPSLETVGPNGPTTCWNNGDPSPAPSAAADWFMHSSNAGASVCSRLVAPTTVPGPGGSRMLHFRAGGNEGGIYQYVDLPPDKDYMFSVWVFVRRGHVAIQSNAMTGGPVAWSTKIGEWEQLRVCTNSLSSTNMLVIYNQDENGGDFYVDRIELREIPTLE